MFPMIVWDVLTTYHTVNPTNMTLTMLQIPKVRYGMPVSTSRHPGRRNRSDRRARAVLHSDRRMRRAARHRAHLGTHDQRAYDGDAVRSRRRAHQPVHDR